MLQEDIADAVIEAELLKWYDERGLPQLDEEYKGILAGLQVNRKKALDVFKKSQEDEERAKQNANQELEDRRRQMFRNQSSRSLRNFLDREDIDVPSNLLDVDDVEPADVLDFEPIDFTPKPN